MKNKRNIMYDADAEVVTESCNIFIGVVVCFVDVFSSQDISENRESRVRS